MAENKNNVPLCEGLSFAGKEAYKRLRSNILFSFTDRAGSRIIGVSSPQMGDGKSTTAINLAYSMAELGKKVLLIDADMRRPSVHSKLNFEQTPGLSNVLTGLNLEKEIIHVYAPEESEHRVDVLTAGDIVPNPSELLLSESMQSLMEKARSAYDFIFLDLPPVTAATDAQLVASLSDGMILIIRENHCSRSAVDECLTQLKFANARVLGFVINGASASGKGYSKYGKYGKYSYNSYGYNYGSEEKSRGGKK